MIVVFSGQFVSCKYMIPTLQVLILRLGSPLASPRVKRYASFILDIGVRSALR